MLAVGLYALYDVVHGLVAGSPARAVADGHALLGAEQVLHLDPELAINSLLDRVAPLAIPACFFYATLHFVVTPGVLVWTYRRRPASYGRARTTLALITGIALLGFWLFPTAPPRMLTGAGFDDTLHHYQAWGWWSSDASVPGALQTVANRYAAMPSLHVAWAAWCGATVFSSTRSRVWRAAAVAYPVLTALVVLGTANHYLLDVLAGLALWAACTGVVRRLDAVRTGRDLLKARWTAVVADGTGSPRRRQLAWIGGAVALLTSSTVVLVARWGPDWPAQEFRTWIARHDGLSMWTMRWYSGTALPGYSVLYPVVTRLLDPGIVGVAACVAITLCSVRYTRDLSPVRTLMVLLAVGVSVMQNLLIGQVPFLLGAAFGLGALLALPARRSWMIPAALAALCSLTSPLAGLFLLLFVPIYFRTALRRRALTLLPAGLGALVAAVVGGAGGPFPCPWQTFAGVLAFCAAILAWTPRQSSTLRTFAATYALLAVMAFAVPNPVGGNVARLAKLLAIPLACYFLNFNRPTIFGRSRLLVLGAAAVMWPSEAFASCIVSGAADPSQAPGYYAAVDRYLVAHRPPGTRVEVPFTREHWEALFVADRVPIARGWERQTDLKYNNVLYHPLSAVRYRTWLAENAVGLVALPRAPKDAGGLAETALLSHRLPYLTPVWQDSNWRVWRVTSPTPIVSGDARLADEDSASLTLRFVRAGTAVVRVRASRLWTASDPASCISHNAIGWLQVTSPHAGDVRIEPKLNARMLLPNPVCS